MARKAFTYLELLFVIVTVGILAGAIIPRVERDTLYEAAEQLLGHIKLTQHMALVNDVYDDKESLWFKEMWRISFYTCIDGGKYYTVFSDTNHGGHPNVNECARDPITRNRLYANNNCQEEEYVYSGVFLTKKYGIKDVVLGGGCFGSNQYVAFDTLGRPHDDLATPHHVVRSPCTITLVHDDGEAVIRIEPETGYAHIVTITDY